MYEIDYDEMLQRQLFNKLERIFEALNYNFGLVHTQTENTLLNTWFK